MSELVPIEKEKNEDINSSSEAHYPYGTSLSLEDDLVEKLGLDSLDAGAAVVIRAEAVVQSKNEQVEDDGDVEKRVHLQLTAIAVANKPGNNVAQLYPDDKSGG